VLDSEFKPGVHAGSVVATLAEPTAADPVRLAVIADPHVATRSEGTSKLFDVTERHFRHAITDARAREVDAVLSVGDLTKDGEPWNFEAVDDIVADLDVPFYSVPGNHDVPKASDEHEPVPVNEFARRYAPDNGFPFATRVGDVDIVGINTAGTAELLHDTHEGAISADRVSEVVSASEDADAPIVLAHHNLPAMHDQFRAHRDAVEPEMGLPPTTRDGEVFVETLAAAEPSVLVTGHLHMPSTATQAGVREVMMPTTCSFPQSYCTLEVGHGGTVVRLHPVAAQDGLKRAYSIRSTHTVGSRGQTAMAAERLAAFPLVDEIGHASLERSPVETDSG